MGAGKIYQEIPPLPLWGAEKIYQEIPAPPPLLWHLTHGSCVPNVWLERAKHKKKYSENFYLLDLQNLESCLNPETFYSL